MTYQPVAGITNIINQVVTTKDAVAAASVAGLSAYTYLANTLTVNAAEVLVVDGYTTLLGDRILVKNETAGNAKYNGLWSVTTLGTNLIPWVLTRTADMNQSSEVVGSNVFVSGGTVNAASLWAVTTTGAFTLNTTAMTWGIVQSVFPATADLSMNSHKLTNVTDPSSAQDVATKNYVDTHFDGAILTHSVAQAISSNEFLVAFDTETADTNNYHSGSNGYVTIPTTGYYQISYGLRYVDNTVGIRYAFLGLNNTATPYAGSAYYGITTGLNALGVGCGLSSTVTLSLTVGDTIGLYTFQNANPAGTLNISGTTFLTFSIRRVH